MTDRPPTDRATVPGRLAIASVATAFAMAGVPRLLDAPNRDQASAVVQLGLLLAVGALATKALQAGRVISGLVLGMATFIGLFAGMVTRPWNFWYPPLHNALWVSAWTFLGACVGSLLGDPEFSTPAKIVLGVVTTAILLAWC